MAAKSGTIIDLRTFIDTHGVSRFQWLLMALCFLIVFVDGVDTAAVGFVAPALVQAFHVKRESLGPVLSAALVGLAIGSAFAGPIADRLGRKTVLVASVLLFACGSLASALSPNLDILSWTRLATGLGLGAAMPNAITLTAEFAPERWRSMSVSGMFCGYTFGSALGGFAAAALIPHFGWPSVFLAGGLFPLALAPVLLILLPESARFLVVRGAPHAKIAAVLARVAPSAKAELAAASGFTTPELELGAPKNRLGMVLSPPYRAGTLLMWVTFFMGLVVVFLLTSWLPTLLRGAGFTLSASAVVTALFQLGGTAGALLVAWGMGRFGGHRAIALSYVVGGACILALASGLHSTALLSLGVLGAGFFISGAQSGMNALAPGFYPTQIRATGVGSMLAFGRLGAILGAYVGAPLLAMGWGFSSIIQVLTIPALIAASAIAIKGVLYGRGAAGGGGAPAEAEPAAVLAGE